ncbi:MAG: VTT domain-containing protein [Butyrivibrio sp.]|nr:VTT domain-containing protein [Butyrivibrio sp.]
MGDVIALIIFIFVSWLAWKLKDVLKEWMPLTLIGLLLICFVMNSTVLLPSSSLLVVLEYSYVLNPISVIMVGTIGASLGELTGYMVGAEGTSLVRRFKKVSNLTKFREHSFLWVMLFAFIPFPVFDVAGIMAGSIRMNPFKFLLASFIGKAVKMSFYVWIIHFISIIFG